MFNKVTASMLLTVLLLSSYSVANAMTPPSMDDRFPFAYDAITSDEFVQLALDNLYAGNYQVNLHIRGSYDIVTQGIKELMEQLDQPQVPHYWEIDNIDVVEIDSDQGFDFSHAQQFWVKILVTYRSTPTIEQRFPNATEVRTPAEIASTVIRHMQAGERTTSIHFMGSLEDFYSSGFLIRNTLDPSTVPGYEQFDHFDFVDVAADRSIFADAPNDIYAKFQAYPINWGAQRANPIKPFVVKASALNDVPSDWAAASVDQAMNFGLVPPDLANSFTSPITREEFAELIVNAYEMMTGKKAALPDINKFIDTNNPYVLKANNLNIVSGVGNARFNPRANITREELACMLARFLTAAGYNPMVTMEYRSFADADQVSDWAMPSVQLTNKLGILGGVGEGRIDPQGHTTREQAVIMVLRIFTGLGGQ